MSSYGNFSRALREFGVTGTFMKLYKMRTLKFGKLVGTDQFGNKYYENTKDYQQGMHRWCEYAGFKNFYEVDPSIVPPEWHLWLHHTTQAPPTATTTGSITDKPVANASISHAPYERPLAGVIGKHQPNLSLYRPRGYGLNNGVFPDSVPGEELYYTQPGHILDPRNAWKKGPNRSFRLGFTLKDTPATIQAKAAVRAGLTPEEYKDYTSPLMQRLVTSKGIGAGNISSVQNMSEAEAIALGLPANPEKRELAVRAARGEEFAPTSIAGTFEAAVEAALTAEERAFLETGHDEDALITTIRSYTKMVNRYADKPGKDAERGVAEATAARDAAVATLAKLQAIGTKLKALEDEFDAKAFEAVQQGAQKAHVQMH